MGMISVRADRIEVSLVFQTPEAVLALRTQLDRLGSSPHLVDQWNWLVEYCETLENQPDESEYDPPAFASLLTPFLRKHGWLTEHKNAGALQILEWDGEHIGSKYSCLEDGLMDHQELFRRLAPIVEEGGGIDWVLRTENYVGGWTQYGTWRFHAGQLTTEYRQTSKEADDECWKELLEITISDLPKP